MTTKTIKLINSGNEITFDVEIAQSFLKKAIGLMGRKNLFDNSGMLFIFNQPNRHSFWMFATRIPLEAIFFDENGFVVDIINMEPRGLNPFNCPKYSPKNDAKYVLEVNSGFVKRNKVVVGSKLVLNDSPRGVS